MDKLVRNIIISVVVVLLLGASYVAITVIPGQIEERNNQELEAETGDILILSTSIDNVSSVKITNQNTSYTFMRDQTGAWAIKEHPGMLLETTIVESAVYGLSNIYALEEIDLPENLDDYGLSKPRAEIVTTMKDGSERVFKLGNKVAGGKGDFFLDSTNNKAYVVSIYMADTLNKMPNDYRKAKLATLSSDILKSMSITNSNGKIVMGLEKSDYSSELVMVMTEPKHMDLDETLASSIFEHIQDISVVQYIEDNPTDLSKYGLKNPPLIIEMGTGDKQYKLSFGNKAEDGTVYTMLEGMNFVFTYNPELYDVCLGVSPYNLMNKFVNIVNISDVKSVTVSGKGKSHTLEIKGGNDFYIDGKAALADSFRKAYQSIVGIKGSGLAEKNVTSPIEYTVVFEYNNGEKTTNTYASYDATNYYVETNGERGFITLKKGLDDMMGIVEKLASNPMGKMN